MKQIDRIFEILQSGSRVEYGNERVSQLDHALQCAALAEQQDAPAALVSAALLHDIGHLLNADERAAFARGDDARLGMAGIFESGFREFGRSKKQRGLTRDQMLEGARRSMRVSQLREVDRLEDNLAFLATVGSTSPYVGLFGTVWGIMNTFSALGNLQSATLALVAPGIAEALIATAMGLFAAIPAVIFFNRYADKVGRLEVRFDTFMEEFSAILQRHAAQPEGAAE